MRIAIDNQSTLGRKTGIGLYTINLLKAMRKVAPQHEYITLNLKRSTELRTDQRLRWQQIQLPQLARAARADLLHIPGFDAPKFKPFPVVLTVHDLIGMLFPQNLPPIARFYWSKWLPKSIRWADRILADSEQTRRDIVRLLSVPVDQITVIPLGVSPQFHPIQDTASLQTLRNTYQLPDKFVLFLGTLEPRKGIDTLIRSYSLIADEVSQDLVIAGKKGWYTESLFDLVQHRKVKDRVHFIGYVTDDKLPALMSAADAFAFPSRYEGFGLPPLEAMACGTPVISTNISSLPEVIGDAGLLIPPDDINALAQALGEVLSTGTLRDRLTALGIARVQRFTWDTTARKTVAVYEEMAP